MRHHRRSEVVVTLPGPLAFRAPRRETDTSRWLDDGDSSCSVWAEAQRHWSGATTQPTRCVSKAVALTNRIHPCCVCQPHSVEPRAADAATPFVGSPTGDSIDLRTNDSRSRFEAAMVRFHRFLHRSRTPLSAARWRPTPPRAYGRPDLRSRCGHRARCVSLGTSTAGLAWQSRTVATPHDTADPSSQ